MSRISSARIAGPTQDRPLPDDRRPAPLRDELIIATVGMRTPRLTGADWLRIDGGHPLVDAESLRCRHDPYPVLYDIPGPGSARFRNLLTTTESLVFAASTGFDWVNLRDLEDPGDLERARTFLDDGTRLSCTITEPRVLQRSLDQICSVGDAVLLDLRVLGHKLPPTYCDALTLAVVRRAREHETPVLVIPTTATVADPTGRGAAAELGRVGQLLAAGAHGLVLTSETAHSAGAQEAIDLARDMVRHARPAATSGRARHSARLGADDDASGWITF